MIGSLLPFGTQRGSWRAKYCLQGIGDQRTSMPSPTGSFLASGQSSQLSMKNNPSNACVTWKRCCFSVVSDSLRPHGLQHARPPCPSPSPELPQTHVHRVSDAIQPPSPPLHLPPSILPSIRVFSNESVLGIRGPKYWSFSISPSNEYSGLISFRMD